MKSGKRFEDNIRKSVNVFFYRFRDGTSSWDKGKSRFQQTNIADCEIFDGDNLFILELKSTNEHSLPFNNIKKHQIQDLTRYSIYKNVICGFLINYEKYDECYFIEISLFNDFLTLNDRKSIPIEFARENGVKIPLKRLRTNKVYELGELYEFGRSKYGKRPYQE